MKYYRQRIPHNPLETYGDCFRTALGCLLNMRPKDVPHFFHRKFSPEEWDGVWTEVRTWVRGQGYLWFAIPFRGELSEILGCMKMQNPGVRYLLAGASPRGNHQVVAFEDRIEWDPHPANTGLVGPDSEGFYWVNLVLPLLHGEG